ncbi:MAG TPA: LLM class flavin-dependent oxidoreductase, partial [Candidatus Dormibacteraeota bacterium]|nr:LLM class flavin-dependent oxidoreductase [Candidatus Dormibacteraeota bacterium]
MASVKSGFRLGFLTHVAGTGDAATTLAETVRLVQLAEELGYESAWVAQHHLDAESGVLPSPFVFLAAAAARTSRIRLGTGVVILPLEDPIRVAEDAAVA